MPAPRFGTDGVRGVANADLTIELAAALGRAAARVLPAPTFVVGRDTRRSGPMLQAAFSAGLAAEGADVVDLGVLPTPGVAYVAADRGLPGAVVSASHNVFSDNGIKLFSDAGAKLSLDTEAQIEAALDAILADPDAPPLRPTGFGVGRLAADPVAVEGYLAHLPGVLDGRDLEGLHVVIDGANGAAAAFAPAVFEALGATVTALSCEPDGANINDACGSTHPTAMARAVVETGAHLGLALDGDADRLVAADHTGTVVDGDTLLALFATDMAARGKLAGNTVVVTVMTHLGFHRAMADHAIAVRETPVGDRHVLAALDAEGLALGGEQSGHLVFRQRSTTGDGLLTGLVLADLVARAERPLADLTFGLVEPVPQVLVNVAVADPGRLQRDGAESVWAEVAAVEADLGDTGRVLLRPSGTEPLVRVLVEAADAEAAEAAAVRLRDAVLASLAAPDPGDPPASDA